MLVLALGLHQRTGVRTGMSRPSLMQRPMAAMFMAEDGPPSKAWESMIQQLASCTLLP